MASSGIIKSWTVPSGSYTDGGNSYAGAHYSFEWTSTYKSPGVTTVSWNLYGRGRYSTPSQLYHRIRCNLTVNGSTTSLFSADYLSGATDAQHSFKDKLKASGSFDVTHTALSGAGSFTIAMSLAVYAYNQYHDTSETATLDTNRSAYTLTLSANGGSGGGSQTLNHGVSTAIAPPTAPSRSNHTFLGWNTSSDGSGTMYQTGNSISITADTTLYAQWGNIYYVSYNGNGATSGTVPSRSTHYNKVSSTLQSNNLDRKHTVTFNGNGGTASSTSLVGDYSPNGWNTNTSGTGTHYSSGETVTGLTSSAAGTVTLYAQWSGGGITLPTATRSGYRFIGWNTNSSGTGTKYAAGSTYYPTSNITLYAQWAAASGAGNSVYIKINGSWKLSKT